MIVKLDHDEWTALSFIADRYVCGEYLWERAEVDDDDETLMTIALSDDEIVTYQRLLVEENNYPAQMVPPCAGGTLADKLMTFIAG